MVYDEANTGHVRAIDVASGRDWLIDGSGAFGSLSISGDRQHVAYVGSDAAVRIADLEGNITTLALPNGATTFTGCVPGPSWGPNNSLAYCIYDDGFASYGFMPAPGESVRKLLATELAISDDASRIVYHRRESDPSKLGDVVVENADGSDQRVLQPSIIETALMFTPDGQHVVAVAEHPEAFRVVIHDVSDGTTRDLGPGDLPRAIRGGSIFSADHSEMLAVLGDELVAVNLETGAKRHFTTVTSETRISQAAFIAEDRVIYRRLDATIIPGSDVEESSQSIRIASALHETTMMIHADLCYVHSVTTDGGFAAVDCDNAAIVSFDGTVRASIGASAALGISDDDSGIATIADDGTVSFVTTDGESRPLAQAMPWSQIEGALRGPRAAYAP